MATLLRMFFVSSPYFYDTKKCVLGAQLVNEEVSEKCMLHAMF